MPEPRPKSVDYVAEVFNYYHDYRRRRIEGDLIKYLKAYTAYDDEYEQYKAIYGEDGWRSVLYFPIVYANIETLVPRLVMAMVGDPNVIELEATEESDVQMVDPLETILRKQWKWMGGFNQTLAHVRNVLTYGFGWVKLGWVYNEMVRRVAIPRANIFGRRVFGSVEKKQRVVVQNHPVMQSLPPERIYWDPGGKHDLSTHMVLLDRYMASRRFVTDQQAFGDWKNVGDINWEKSPEVDDELEVTRKELNKEDPEDSYRVGPQNKWHKRCEIIEAYGLSLSGKPRWKIIIANRQTELFNAENPFPFGHAPLLFSRNSTVAGRFTAPGEAEYSRATNMMINRLRNYHIDNVQLAVNGMWLKNRLADIDDNQLVSRPWGIVETNDMEGLLPLPLPPVTNDALIEARQLEQDIQLTSGVVDFIRGTQQPGAPETATAAERLTQAATARFAARTKSIQEDFIVKQFDRMIQLNIKNLGRAGAIRIAGKAGVRFQKLRLDQVQGSFDVTVRVTNESISDSVAINQLMTMYQLFRGDPQIDQRALKLMLVHKLVPGAEGKLLTSASEELTPEEENAVMVNGGVVLPSPNDDHNDHLSEHSQFLLENEGTIDEIGVKNIQDHMAMHNQIQLSVFKPLQGQNQPTAPLGPGGAGGNGGGLSTFDAGVGTGQRAAPSDAASAAGGRNAPQPNRGQ